MQSLLLSQKPELLLNTSPQLLIICSKIARSRESLTGVSDFDHLFEEDILTFAVPMSMMSVVGQRLGHCGRPQRCHSRNAGTAGRH